MSWKKGLLELVGDLVGVLGTWQTVVLLAIVFISALVYAYKSQGAKNRGFDAALAAKEDTIQRMAAENKSQRRHIFSLQGVSNEQIEFLLGDSKKAED